MTKPTQFGNGAGKFREWGKGTQVTKVPEPITLTFADFRGGYNTALGRDHVPVNSSPDMQDIQVTASNRLKRLPGSTIGVDLVVHPSYEMVLHESLGNVGELLFFSPPHLGVYDLFTFPSYVDYGLHVSSEPFRTALYGDELVFSNGRDGPWVRKPASAPIASTTIPQGKTFAVLAARLFVGGAEIDGTYQPMGMAWNASSGNVQDFQGEGSGFELLISDASKGDAIIGARMMNLDLMGIICKHSIWVGRRTNDPFRPAAFEPRIMGVGGLTDRTVLATPLGICYLAETGLRAFDGNSSVLISEAINNELLPLDYAQINDYKLTYDPRRNWLFLHTPVYTWIFDIEHTRWYRYTFPSCDGVLFKTQVPGTTWDDLSTIGSTWDDLLGTSWADLDRREIGQGTMIYLRRLAASSIFFKEDEAFETFGGVPMYPRWEFQHQSGEYDNSIVTTDKVLIEYKGSGDIRIWLPDDNGSMVQTFRQTLDETFGRLITAELTVIRSGRGAAVMIELVSGNMEVAKVQLVIDPRSSTPTKPSTGLQEYIGYTGP